jgi:hypothetical protein
MIDYICDKCNGSGKIVTTEGLIFKKHYSKVCNRCYGAGKLNWIENVLGKDDSSFDKLFVFNTALSSEEALSSYRNF